MNNVEATKTMNRPIESQRSRNWLLVWVRRVGLGLLITLVTLTVSGATYQVIATALDARAFPPPGHMVDVGGHKMHIYCTGAATAGNPTVILEHVGAANAAQWGLVQPEIAKATQVCAYDRSGFGWSEAGPTPRDARQSMHELHTLLANAGIPGPYVLVGHSFGANVAQLYAAEYPQEVAGMVLVDPGAPYDSPGVPAHVNEEWKNADQSIMRLAPYLSRLGLMRLAFALGAVPGNGDLPAPIGAAYDALNLSSKFWDTLGAQNKAMVGTSQQVLSASQAYSTLPLIVLSATLPANEGRDEWTKLNGTLAARSSNGRHRIVDGASHMSLALELDEAQVTTTAILQVLESARTGTLLR